MPPFAIVSVDGGSTYWHRRADGDDAVLARGDDPPDSPRSRGESIPPVPPGGALLLASALGPDRVAAVAVSSAAVFVLRRIPVRIDCGVDDPFGPQDTLLRDDLGHPAGAITAGCHDQAFWRRTLPAQLAFLAPRLRPA